MMRGLWWTHGPQPQPKDAMHPENIIAHHTIKRALNENCVNQSVTVCSSISLLLLVIFSSDSRKNCSLRVVVLLLLCRRGKVYVVKDFFAPVSMHSRVENISAQIRNDTKLKAYMVSAIYGTMLPCLKEHKLPRGTT